MLINTLTERTTKLMSESLSLQYVPLSHLVGKFLEGNPKLHDIDKICESIVRYGFRDPLALDKTADAIVEGNGRLEAVMKLNAYMSNDPPRGIKTDADGGWLVPVLVGLDADSVEEAKAYSIDHNNLSLEGGDFTPFDFARLYSIENYGEFLQELSDSETMPVSVPQEDLSLLLSSISGLNDTSGGSKRQNSGADDWEYPGDDLGENKKKAKLKICPNCGHEF